MSTGWPAGAGAIAGSFGGRIHPQWKAALSGSPARAPAPFAPEAASVVARPGWVSPQGAQPAPGEVAGRSQYCPACGSANAGGARFCPDCGVDIGFD
ncbi:MAG: zinc ribbon domain-containing protein [Acidimicrobiales bacterium]